MDWLGLTQATVHDSQLELECLLYPPKILIFWNTQYNSNISRDSSETTQNSLKGYFSIAWICKTANDTSDGINWVNKNKNKAEKHYVVSKSEWELGKSFIQSDRTIGG